jgi:hypothetical protein
MSSGTSGAGYGNHGGDETFEDNKGQTDPSRAVPDDSAVLNEDEDKDDASNGGDLPQISGA